MCGIAGWVHRSAPGDPAVLTAMTRALQHRGPDDEGFYFNSQSQSPHVGLGFRRLSIIDLGSGRQPMTSEDESLWIVFNGEIYNFQELREELEARGHQFRSRSDTETILHLYEELGEGCLNRLRGMFALALWDANRQALFLARDRVGKKPLMYAPLPDGGLAFASEMQGLLQHPGVARAVNVEALDSYLTFGYLPPPGTGFRGVFKLPPAHWLRWRAGDVTVQRYWQLEYLPKLELNEDEACEQLLHELREAVRLRMIADVPLGAFLSGGLDSSLVVALMSEVSDQPVKTFSIGFAEADFNELDYARAVAERYATDHHELVVEPNALEVVSKLARHYGEPYADSSAVPSYCVAQATRAHVTVALNGDGGDESFAGYERYLGVTLAERYQRLPQSLRRGVIEPAARALLPDSVNRRSRLRQARRFLQVAARPLHERYLSWVTTLAPGWKQALYTDDFAALRTDDARWFRELLNGGDALSPLDRVLRTDVSSYLPFDLLVKMDIATMANSLEARSPFLDHRVMEFAARLPASFKLRGRSLKYLLKRAAGPLLPPQNIDRRKQGFGVPVGEWFRGPLRELLIDTVCSQRALDRGYFKPEGLRRLVTQHLERREDNTYPLWALLMLELWHRELTE